MPLQDALTPRRVHLLGGLSDAGKTRFILPAMLNWIGAPPWCYVVGDRTLDDAQDSMRDMGINPADVPTVPAFGADIQTEHQCPKCGYVWSGSSKVAAEEPAPKKKKRNGKK